jgi:hypothetical protein
MASCYKCQQKANKLAMNMEIPDNQHKNVLKDPRVVTIQQEAMLMYKNQQLFCIFLQLQHRCNT